MPSATASERTPVQRGIPRSRQYGRCAPIRSRHGRPEAQKEEQGSENDLRSSDSVQNAQEHKKGKTAPREQPIKPSAAASDQPSVGIIRIPTRESQKQPEPVTAVRPNVFPLSNLMMPARIWVSPP